MYEKHTLLVHIIIKTIRVHLLNFHSLKTFDVLSMYQALYETQGLLC